MSDKLTEIMAAQRREIAALIRPVPENGLARAVARGAGILGVDYRDLAVLKIDPGLSGRLIPQFPRDVIAAGESDVVDGIGAARVRAVLVGETLMQAPDPAVLVVEFRRA
jgi:indole-3-glycerol phosphate synthase